MYYEEQDSDNARQKKIKKIRKKEAKLSRSRDENINYIAECVDCIIDRLDDIERKINSLDNKMEDLDKKVVNAKSQLLEIAEIVNDINSK